MAVNWLCETAWASTKRPSPLERGLHSLLDKPLEFVLQRRAELAGAVLLEAGPSAVTGTGLLWLCGTGPGGAEIGRLQAVQLQDSSKVACPAVKAVVAQVCLCAASAAVRSVTRPDFRHLSDRQPERLLGSCPAYWGPQTPTERCVLGCLPHLSDPAPGADWALLCRLMQVYRGVWQGGPAVCST